MGPRQVKTEVLKILQGQADPAGLAQWPARQVITALLAALARPEPAVRHRAAAELGLAAARLAAAEGAEAVRETCRRLLWALNDDSGTAPWGAAEGLAEVLVQAPELRPEFGPLLVGLLRVDPDSPPYAPLVEGKLWALGRLAQADPALTAGSGPGLARFLASPEPRLRALAAWVAGQMRAREVGDHLAALAHDQAEVRLWLEGREERREVGEVARLAQERLASARPR